MATHEEIREVVDMESYKGDFKGDVILDRTGNTPHFDGSIDTATFSKIRLGYNPAYQKEATEERLEEILGADPMLLAMRDTHRHEIGHRGYQGLTGCPRTTELHADGILEPIMLVMKEKNIADGPVGQGHTVSSYLANLLEDGILNAEHGLNDDYTGMWLTYRNDANHTSKGEFGKLFEAFIKLQLWQYGDQTARRLMRPYLPGNEDATKAVTQFLTRTGLVKNGMTASLDTFLGDYRIDNPLTIATHRKEEIKMITDEKEWPRIARIFAEEFGPLVDPTSPDCFIKLLGGNEFKDALERPETKMELVWKRYKDEEPENDGKKKSGKKPGDEKETNTFVPPAYLDPYDALDMLYRRIVRGIDIRTGAHTRKEPLPVTWYGKREFDPRYDRGRRMKPIITSEGTLGIGVGAHPYTIDIKYQSKPRGIPKIQLGLLDTSASMRIELRPGGKVMNPWAPPERQWTDTSRYHHGLTAWYALLDLSAKHGVLKHTSVRFGQFSNETMTATGLDASKRLALQPQFGDTYLNVEKVRRMFAEEGALTITMSDGDIVNWKEIRSDFIAFAKRQHYFHLQIGDGGGAFCEDLENAGLKVVHDDGSKLAKIVVDLTTPILTAQRRQDR